MTAPLILARTFRDAHAFAQDELKLMIGHYRVVNSSGTIKAIRGADLFLVPGWRNRPDRFVMQSAMKWCRLNVIDVTEWRAAQVPVADMVVTVVPDDTVPPEGHAEMVAKVLPEPDGLQPSGVQLTLGDATEFFHAPAEEPSGPLPFAPPIPPAPEPEVAPEPVEDKKPGRRRRRCKDCGTLHYKDDPCPKPDEEN